MAKRDLYTAPRQQGTSMRSAAVDDLPSGQDRLNEIIAKYQSNKKLWNYILIGLGALILGYFAYKFLVAGPREKEAANALGLPNTYMLLDSTKWMVEGRLPNEMGSKKIADNYGGTAAGNLARYMTGVGYLKMGKFKEAITYLEKFDGKGTLLGTLAQGCIGDAYWELNQLDKAAEAYEKASADLKDPQFAPLYLDRAAQVYEAQGKNDKALAAYRKLKKEFPSSSAARDLDRNLARLGDITED